MIVINLKIKPRLTEKKQNISRTAIIRKCLKIYSDSREPSKIHEVAYEGIPISRPPIRYSLSWHLGPL